jgi:hypothetical protein
MLKWIVASFLPLPILLLFPGSASAWFHGNRWGGSTSHTYGSTTHDSAWGTSTSHTYGEGTSHTNIYGGSATHYYGGGWSKTGAYGGTAYGDARYGGAYYHPAYATYPGYHPPATVNYYGSGCYNCGGWGTAAAAATGAVLGASIASASSANAYSAGYAAGATAAYTMGAIYPTLPTGAIVSTVGGATYYVYNRTWFQPSYGANGVYYRVVPAP